MAEHCQSIYLVAQYKGTAFSQLTKKSKHDVLLHCFSVEFKCHGYKTASSQSLFKSESGRITEKKLCFIAWRVRMICCSSCWWLWYDRTIGLFAASSQVRNDVDPNEVSMPLLCKTKRECSEDMLCCCSTLFKPVDLLHLITIIMFWAVGCW